MRDYPLIGIYSWGKGIFHREPKPGAELGSFRFFGLEAGDLVLSNIQAWEGAIGVARAIDANAIGTHRFLTYVPKDGRLDTTWAKWFFLSEPGMALIRKASPGTTMRNRTLAIDRFESLEIPLPRIDEQRRVATHLDRIEASTAAIREQTTRAATLHDALLVSLATRGDLSDAAKRKAGWERVPLHRVLAEHIHLVNVEPSQDYPIAGVYSFGRGLFDRAPMAGSRTSYRSLHRLLTGQVVMSRLKAWEGAIAVVPAQFDGYFLSPEFPTFSVDAERADIAYLGAVLATKQFWEKLASTSRGIGARRERVHSSRLLEQVVDLPPLEVQQLVSRTMADARALHDQRSEMQTRLEALLPAALNEAFASLS